MGNPQPSPFGGRGRLRPAGLSGERVLWYSAGRPTTLSKFR
jgi:hypothetical protein